MNRFLYCCQCRRRILPQLLLDSKHNILHLHWHSLTSHIHRQILPFVCLSPLFGYTKNIFFAITVFFFHFVHHISLMNLIRMTGRESSHRRCAGDTLCPSKLSVTHNLETFLYRGMSPIQIIDLQTMPFAVCVLWHFWHSHRGTLILRFCWPRNTQKPGKLFAVCARWGFIYWYIHSKRAQRC